MQTKLTYVAGTSGLVVAGLTVTELVGVGVGIVSIITMIFASYSNHKKNKRQKRIDELQEELLIKQIEE